MIGEIDVRDTICPSEAKAFANALIRSVWLTHTHRYWHRRTHL